MANKRVLDETIGAFKELKKQVEEYKNQLATLTVGTEEWNKKAEQMRNAQKQVDAINKAAKGTLVTFNKEQNNSINALKERIKLLNQERNAMDMNSKEYKVATKELKKLNDDLRDSATSAGDWRANVGNYSQAISSALGNMGAVSKSVAGDIGGLNASLLKLAANPVGAVIAAIAIAIAALAKGISSSEENTKRWEKAMIPVKAVLLTIQDLLQKLASKFLDLVESFKMTEGQSNALKKVLQGIITFFGLLWDRVKALTNTCIDLVKSLKPVGEWMVKVGKDIYEFLTPAIEYVIKLWNKFAGSVVGRKLGLHTIDEIKKKWNESAGAVETLTGMYEKNTEKARKMTKETGEGVKENTELLKQQVEVQRELNHLTDSYNDAVQAKDWVKAQEELNKKKEKAIELARIQAKLNKGDEGQAVADAEYSNNRAQMELDVKIKDDNFKTSLKEMNDGLKELEETYNEFRSNLETPIMPQGGEITKQTLQEYYDQVIANAQAEYDAYAAMMDAKIEKLQEFVDAEKAAGNDVAAQEEQLAKLRKEQTNGYAKQWKAAQSDIVKATKDRVKQEKALNRNNLSVYADFFDAIGGLFEENTIAYKATATAKALINTYLGATAAFTETPGPIYVKAIAMAAAIAAGIAQVVSILKVNAKGENSGGATSAPSMAVPEVAETVPYTYSRTLQTEEEVQQLNQPVWVSVRDIEDGLNKAEVTERESSF